MTPPPVVDDRRCFRPIYLAFSLGGLAAMAMGSFIVLYIYAFASMVDPTLQGAAYWRKVAEAMFFTPVIIPTLLGLTLALGGAFATLACLAVAVGWVGPRALAKTGPAILTGLLALLALCIAIAACA